MGGGLISDGSRGIADISYDCSGNPARISYADGGYTEYVYSASGEKLRMIHSSVLDALAAGTDLYGVLDSTEDMDGGLSARSITEYRGDVIYRDGKVWMVLFPGGNATLEGGVTFHYYTQDYLGNVRAVINGTTGEVEQTVAYYPFGGVIADLGTPHGGQPFRFGGKELVTANGLNEYDFGARQYWQAVPHFTRIYPLCERPIIVIYILINFPHIDFFCWFSLFKIQIYFQDRQIFIKFVAVIRCHGFFSFCGCARYQKIVSVMILEKQKNWKNNKIVGHLAAFITVLCWGCSFIASKVLMEGADLTPVEVYVYRFFLAYILMMCFTFREIRSKSWTDELQLALCGLCSGTLYFLMENYALMYTTTGNVSLLSSISPIFTAILLAIIYKTTMKKGEVIGSMVAFVGVALVILSESIAKGLGLEIHPFGDLLALSCALSWAVYSIAIKRLIPLYSTLFITRKLFFYGLVTSIPLLIIQKEPLHLATLFDFSHPVYLLNLLFLAVMCSSMAYLFWNESMKIIGPLATNNYIYIQAPVTMFAGSLILGETIYPFGYVGCILVLAGLVVADKMKK